MSSPSPSPAPPASPAEPSGFTDYLSRAWAARDRLGVLVFVPALHAVLQVGSLRRLAASRADASVSVSFPFPAPLVDVWNFVNVPAGSGGVHVGPEAPLLPVLVAVEAALLAGYLGSLDEGLRTGSFDFAGNVRRYFLRFLAWQALVTVAVLLVGVLGLASGALGLLALPAAVVAAYLVYAAPFLFVTRDLGVVEALRRSYGLAVAGGRYATYFLGHVAVGAAISIPTSLVVLNLGSPGVLIGAVALAPVGFAFSTATLLFLRDHDGPRLATRPA